MFKSLISPYISIMFSKYCGSWCAWSTEIHPAFIANRCATKWRCTMRRLGGGWGLQGWGRDCTWWGGVQLLQPLATTCNYWLLLLHRAPLLNFSLDLQMRSLSFTHGSPLPHLLVSTSLPTASFLFLIAVFSREPRLYRRVCPSVRGSVGPSVGPSVRP